MNVHTHAHAGRESYLRGYKLTNGVKTHRTWFIMQECVQSLLTHTHTHTHTQTGRVWLDLKQKIKSKKKNTRRESLWSFHLSIYHSSHLDLELIWLPELQNTELGVHLGSLGILSGTISAFPLCWLHPSIWESGSCSGLSSSTRSNPTIFLPTAFLHEVLTGHRVRLGTLEPANNKSSLLTD